MPLPSHLTAAPRRPGPVRRVRGRPSLCLGRPLAARRRAAPVPGVAGRSAAGRACSALERTVVLPGSGPRLRLWTSTTGRTLAFFPLIRKFRYSSLKFAKFGICFRGLTGNRIPCGILDSALFRAGLWKFVESGESVPDCYRR